MNPDEQWTLESLRYYIESELRAVRKEANFAKEDAAKAISKAEVATEKRLDSMNEFRQQISDRDAMYLTRREYAAFQERSDQYKLNIPVIVATTLASISSGIALIVSLVHHP